MCLTMQSPLRFARKGCRIRLVGQKGADEGLNRHNQCFFFSLKHTQNEAVARG